jgi:hypothetical protein
LPAATHVPRSAIPGLSSRVTEMGVPFERKSAYWPTLAACGTTASRPSTPVEAAPLASSPSADAPIIPVVPVVQSAVTVSPPSGAS